MNRIFVWLKTSSECPQGVAQYDGQTNTYLAQRVALFLNEHDILCRKWYPQEKGLEDMMFNQIVAPKHIERESCNTCMIAPQVLTWSDLIPWIESGTGSTGQVISKMLLDGVTRAMFVHEVRKVQRGNEVS